MVPLPVFDPPPFMSVSHLRFNRILSFSGVSRRREVSVPTRLTLCSGIDMLRDETQEGPLSRLTRHSRPSIPFPPFPWATGDVPLPPSDHSGWTSFPSNPHPSSPVVLPETLTLLLPSMNGASRTSSRGTTFDNGCTRGNNYWCLGVSTFPRSLR